MMNERTLLQTLRRIIHKETIWLRHYYARICNTTDPLEQGRIQVLCFDLGFNTPDIGLWAAPRDKNSLMTLQINDWVEIYFVNGDRNFCVCLGKANELTGMLPKNYDGKATTQILFEDPSNMIKAAYDGIGNILEIGKSDFQFAARQNDETKSEAASDSAFWTFWSAVFGVVTGLPIPEPGGGNPSAFQAALAVAITAAGGTPTSQTGKITGGSDQVKVGKK